MLSGDKTPSVKEASAKGEKVKGHPGGGRLSRGSCGTSTKVAAKRRSEQYGILTAELKDNSDDDLRIVKPDGAVAADTTTAATGSTDHPRPAWSACSHFL